MFHIKLATTAGSVIAITVLWMMYQDSGLMGEVFRQVPGYIMNFCEKQGLLPRATQVAEKAWLACMGWVIMAAVLNRIKGFLRETNELCCKNKIKLFLLLTGSTLLLQKSTWIHTQFNTTQLVLSRTTIAFGVCGYFIGLLHCSRRPKQPEEDRKTISLRLGRIEAEPKDDSKFEKLIAHQFEILQKQIERLRKRLDKADIPVFTAVHEEKRRRTSISERMNTEPEKDQEMPPLIDVVEEVSANKVPKLNRCPHCAQPTHESHRCWVLRKNMKCFKCGGANHVAIACQNLKTGGMQFQVQKELDVSHIEEEMKRLQAKKDQILRKKVLSEPQAGKSNVKNSFLSRSPRLN